MTKWKIALPSFLIAVSMVACNSGSDSSSSHGAGYKETKGMVLDILKTDEGKDTILEALKKKDNTSGNVPGMQILSSGDQMQIKTAVKDVLTDENSSKMLQQMMTDPKFAGDFAKAILKQNKQMQKDLMKDPEYQKSMLDLLKDPEFEKMLMGTLKGREYRQQIMTVMQESMKSPLFQTELMSLLKKVMEEQTKPKEEKEQKSGEKQSEGQGSEQKATGGEG